MPKARDLNNPTQAIAQCGVKKGKDKTKSC